MQPCREGRAGIVGELDNQGSSQWWDEYFLNYNFEASYYMVYSANHADLSLPFYQALTEANPAKPVPMAVRGMAGKACISRCASALGGLSPVVQIWIRRQRSDAAFAAMNFIWEYQYTQDEDFLRKTAYPYLLEVANFWEDYSEIRKWPVCDIQRCDPWKIPANGLSTESSHLLSLRRFSRT